MKNLMLFGFAAVLLSACVEAGPRFESMSEAELAEYNNGRPLSQMIVCAEDDRSFSRVRRRRCGTVAMMYGSEAQLNQLEVQNAASQL
jgi:hypothetical protein